MIMYKQSIAKDGPKSRVYLHEIDTALPRVWVDGHVYRFNSKITKAISVNTLNGQLIVNNLEIP